MMTCVQSQCNIQWFDKSNKVTRVEISRLCQLATRHSAYYTLNASLGPYYRNIVAAGSGKTKDDYKQEFRDYSVFSSRGGEDLTNLPKPQGAANTSISTHSLNLTINGIGDYDVQRLQKQLRDVDGVLDVWIGPFMEGGLRGGFVIANLEVNESTPPLLVLNKIQELDQQLLVLPYKSNSWIWREHKINYGVAGCGKPIILVHGFGGNAGHFAKLIPYLTDKYRVYAIDLLGFGASDKPESENYGPDLWAEMLCDFAKEFAEEGAILIGNSIGSLTALAAAAAGGADLFRGVVLLNCAGAMNRKGLMKENVLIRLLSPIFIVVEYLLQRPRVASFIFDRFRRKENIRKILEEQAYRNKASVTEQLVDILYEPSTKSGATEVFVKVFTGDPGPRPEGLMEQVSVPVLVLWGDSDIWTPPNGPVANFFKRLATVRDNVAVFSLTDVGHCPHDDRPELAVKYILPFLSTVYD
ncbi:hypothetical protein GOP47_0001250 [Adiantum capillus-veneris]|uniref:AB hydrolase-1 domain-containing protein n=1 Tax=Adiantum capillus-veneris TaxID=13818 RepID=A0A9D4VFF6_ADICA|nr:hypothetical protein GOP47_0000682 [Adiantum capillus-veneris]KAI5085081.1 hypothetical protein GOP47_0001250 [Adiantum capillus-veneris]